MKSRFARSFSVFTFLVGLTLPVAAETQPASAELRLPQVFGDNMVLQRDKPVPVWGWAEPGAKVSVTFAGQTKTAPAATNGAWRVTLDPLPASSESRDLVVRTKTGNRTIQISNLLVGDVWLLSGDFGVYWETYSCADAARELPAATNASLRLLKVWSKSSNEPLTDILGEWRACTPENVRGRSALAYFYGRALQRELKVPIGVIEASYRYSSAHGWMPPAAFQMITELQKPREKMESWDSTTPTGKAAFSAAVARVEAWLPVAQKAFKDGQPIPEQPLLPAPQTANDSNYLSIGELSLHYQGMIHPLIPMAIRGAVWSLGESSCLEPDKFHFYLQGLIQSWRQAWGQGDFPFYLELLPQLGAPASAPDALDSWTTMRFEQIKCLALTNTAVAVTFDVSDYVAEARNRQDPAERLARCALAGEYGRKIVSSGPSLKNQRVEGDHIIVSFNHVGAGLVVGEKRGLAPLAELKDGALKGFAIAGADKKWYWADARIVGDTVVVRSDKVAAPAAVRYACSANPVAANLYNRDGLPAVPFRTDDW